MADEIESKVYELAYHLIPELEEADVRAHAQELSDLITRNNGSVLSSKEPKRSHLSYPIHHKQYGYFGVFEFTAPAEAIEKINAQIKLQNNVLRFLLIKRPHGGVALRTLGEPRTGRIKARVQESTMLKTKIPTPAKQEEKAGAKIKTEEIEKEIEEIIKGL